jgi:hypothetical protein
MDVKVLEFYLVESIHLFTLDLYIDNGQKEETESSKIKILIDFLLLNCFI